MTGPLLEVRNLHVSFQPRRSRAVDVVRGISFTLERGQRLGLAGESGCGKSTTLLALMGLLPPNAEVSGEILLDGIDILAGGERSIRPHRSTDLAMVFQGAMNAFNPTQTIGRQILETMRVHRRGTGREDQQRVRDLLELVGIPKDRADRYPHEFSGGMRQRAALAMALANEPRILLADEPTTALDVMVQAQILDLLERLTAELGLALVLVSHDLPLVVETCDSIALMYAGHIVESGPSAALHGAAAHPYTRLLFAAVPDVSIETRVVSIPGAPPRMDEHLGGCDFAPRCPLVQELCRQAAPILERVGERQRAACHFAGELSSEATEAQGAGL